MGPHRVCVHFTAMVATTLLLSACSDMREPTGGGRGSGPEQVQVPLVPASPSNDARGRAASSSDVPLGLRQATIAAVQQDATPEYDFASGATGADATLVGNNTAQRLRAEVNASGVQIESDPSTVVGSSWHLGLQLARVGRGAHLAPVAPAEEPRATSNRASLLHGQGIEEWYVNGPLGIEQGFILDAPPEGRVGTRSDELLLEVQVAGDLTPSMRADGQAVTLLAPSGRRLARYADLFARDASGRALEAWMTVNGSAIVLHVEDALANYPVEVDPLVWTEVAKVLAGDAADSDSLGYSVAFGGTQAIVGAPLEDGATTDEGAAYVFYQNLGGTDHWGQQKKLAPPGALANDWFGFSVALSGDTAIVGAPLEGTASNPVDRGAAYVFERNQGGPDNWGLTKKLLAVDAQAGAHFGYSVAISGDTAIIGASLDDSPIIVDRGAAYIFERNEGGANNWGQRRKLVAGVAQVNAQFGTSVALSGDVAIVGAALEDGVGTDQGAAYVFERNIGGSDNWGQRVKVLASDPTANAHFGFSVAISNATAVVGAQGANGAVAGQGAAYVFDQDFGGVDTWGLRTKLTASDGESTDMFGAAVGISVDTVIVGAYFDDDIGLNAGASYVFGRNEPTPDTWGQVTKITVGDSAAGDHFGFAVSITADGLLIGAPWKDEPAGNDVGAAYVFQLRLTNGEPCAAPTDCVSGFCVDATCCDTDCVGGDTDCSACSIAAGGTVDGTCGPRVDGSVCDDGLFCTAVDTCTGGTCGGTGDPCAADVGDADDDCSESCDEAAGSCTAQDPDGSACEDGVFCDGTDSCSAGVCSVSTGNPCPGPNGNDNCAESCDEAAGSCTGNDPDGASCDNDTRTCRSGVCLGAPGGDCTDGNECQSTFCVDNVCCAEASCAPYRCGPAGDCGVTCTANGDCVTGYRCGVDGHCVPDPAAPGATDETGGCSCRFGSRSSTSRGWWLVPLGLLALGMRGRRRARSAVQ